MGSLVARSTVAAFCIAASLAAQEKPAKPAAKGDAIVVRGCLTGITLESVDSTIMDEATGAQTRWTYELKGDKQLLKKLREEYDGQLVEVTGTVRSKTAHPSAPREKKVGKTKIVVGAGHGATQQGIPESIERMPVLEVQSYEGRGARCRQ